MLTPPPQLRNKQPMTLEIAPLNQHPNPSQQNPIDSTPISASQPMIIQTPKTTTITRITEKDFPETIKTNINKLREQMKTMILIGTNSGSETLEKTFNKTMHHLLELLIHTKFKNSQSLIQEIIESLTELKCEGYGEIPITFTTRYDPLTTVAAPQSTNLNITTDF